MHQAWLTLPLLSTSVSAFYPYHERGDNSKRFVPFLPPSKPQNGGPITLDLHRVQKKDNVFSVVLSNKPSAPNALAINQDGSDYSYFATVAVGSKKQPMYMLIDTGSANTWVFSSDCESETCSIHNTFGAEDSNTLKTSPLNPWNLAYGTGSVSGIVGTDTLAFANYSVSMSFGLALNASSDFDNYPMDGIMGLGRASSDALGSPTIMQVLSQQANLPSNLIGVHLNRAKDNTKDGEIMFGGINTNRFSGQISYTSTVNDDAWEIPVSDVLVDNTPVKFTGKTAIIDTGTTYILMPSKDAAAVHAMIPGSSQNGETFTVPCNSDVAIQFKINGNLWGVSPKDYVGKNSGATCASNIIGHQAFDDDTWILGDVFLKNVYAVFDFDGKRVGFGTPGTGGKLEPASSSSTSPTAASSPNASTLTSKTTTSTSTATSHPSSSSSSSTSTSDSGSGSEGSPYDSGSSSSSKSSAPSISHHTSTLTTLALAAFSLFLIS